MARYIPGQPYTPLPITYNILGYPSNFSKRLLAPDEFQYYYNFLLEDKISEAQKMGVAIVLQADTIQLFQVFGKYFVDEVLKGYVDKFSKLPEDSPEKAIARKEIKNFDNYLKDSKLPADAPAEVVAKARIAQSRVKLGTQAQEQEKQQKLQQMIAEEKGQNLSEIEQKAMKENALISAKAMKDHMRKNIRLYLAGLYNESLGSYFMDTKNSDVEFSIRQYIIGLVEKNADPVIAINAYRKYIDIIPNNPSLGKAKSIVNETLKNFSHPLKNVMKEA
jgi:uncharacterized protein YbgA (DUF1722 family)